MRPPFAQEWLRLRGDGRVALELKRAWILSASVFAAVVVMVLVTTLVAPAGLRWRLGDRDARASAVPAASSIDTNAHLIGLVVLVSLSIGSAARPGTAAPGKRTAPTPAAASTPDRTTPITLTVRSRSGGMRDSTLVYLDGRIDADAPRRLSEALDGVDGKITVWLNSPGGNLFAGMQLGRIIRAHAASTDIVDYRTLRPGTCCRRRLEATSRRWESILACSTCA